MYHGGIAVHKFWGFLAISVIVSGTSHAASSGWRDVTGLCRPITKHWVDKMRAETVVTYSDKNFIELSYGDSYGCWDVAGDSMYEITPGSDACTSLNAFFFLNNDGTVNEAVGCNHNEFYTRRKQNMPICRFGNVSNPTGYYLIRNYDGSSYLLSQSRNDGLNNIQQAKDGRKFVIMNDEYLCVEDKKKVCISASNNRAFPIGFSADTSKNKSEVSPSEFAKLQTPSLIKTVTVSCENIGGIAKWKYTIKKCNDGYDLTGGKCVKKPSSTTPVKPTPDEDTPPTKPDDNTTKPRMEPLQPLPPLPNPGAVVQNPITIENPNLPKPPKLPVLDDDIEIIDEEIEIEDDLFKNLEKDDLHILPILSPDIEIEDEEIVIEDDLFKELEKDTIVVPKLDPDYAARIVCKKKTGAFWNALARECQCIDEKNTEWNADKSACVETAAARAARLAAEAQARIDNAYSKISSANELLTNTLTTMDISKWKTEEGKFNTARLASDSIAGVVLGTAGGLITSTVVKKQQVKQGFEDIECTIGGQSVASFGDQFIVGVK